MRTIAPWLALALAFAAAPMIFSSGSALTTMSLMGVMIVFALSYNMLLGQTGLLSFGHAVYYGLGGFVAIHAMNAIIERQARRARDRHPPGRRIGGARLSGSCSVSCRQKGRESSFP